MRVTKRSCRKVIAASEPDALQIAKNDLGRKNILVHAYAAVSTCQRRHDTLPPFFDSLATLLLIRPCAWFSVRFTKRSCRKVIAASEPDALQIAKNHLSRKKLKGMQMMDDKPYILKPTDLDIGQHGPILEKNIKDPST